MIHRNVGKDGGDNVDWRNPAQRCPEAWLTTNFEQFPVIVKRHPGWPASKAGFLKYLCEEDSADDVDSDKGNEIEQEESGQEHKNGGFVDTSVARAVLILRESCKHIHGLIVAHGLLS